MRDSRNPFDERHRWNDSVSKENPLTPLVWHLNSLTFSNHLNLIFNRLFFVLIRTNSPIWFQNNRHVAKSWWWWNLMEILNFKILKQKKLKKKLFRYFLKAKLVQTLCISNIFLFVFNSKNQIRNHHTDRQFAYLFFLCVWYVCLVQCTQFDDVCVVIRSCLCVWTVPRSWRRFILELVFL